jgi:two-component system alkaline phosphatase synthesis response regulator PhoP
MGKHRILIVDDDHDILELLAYNLDREGFKVMTLDTSTEVVQACRSFGPHLIVLDIMMPVRNGIEVCRDIRSINKFKDIFIFFLTARSERYFQEAALDTGGDDFIEKIIGLRTITKKIKMVLQQELVIRKGVAKLRIGSLRLDRRKMSAILGKREIGLSRPEFELLFFFGQNEGQIISLDKLSVNVTDYDHYSSGTSVVMYLELLIRKLNGRLLHKMKDNTYMLLAE